uniref:Chitin-binding type-2 domain-containing protein n=1 Tax=Trichuris muris TaxID=70415 RepID=A0A5S6QWA7_TRIMR
MAPTLPLWVVLAIVGLARILSMPMPNSFFVKQCEASSKSTFNCSELPCPLDKCKRGAKGLLAFESFPQLFLLCTPKRQFCGVCSFGEVFDPREGSCVKSSRKMDHHFACFANRLCASYKKVQGAVWLRKSDRSFVLCTRIGNICGFCQGKAKFNVDHQSCRVEMAIVKDMKASNALISFNGNFVVSKAFSLRNTHSNVRARVCCHKCAIDSSMSLISYLRLCRF